MSQKYFKRPFAVPDQGKDHPTPTQNARIKINQSFRLGNLEFIYGIAC